MPAQNTGEVGGNVIYEFQSCKMADKLMKKVVE